MPGKAITERLHICTAVPGEPVRASAGGKPGGNPAPLYKKVLSLYHISIRTHGCAVGIPAWRGRPVLAIVSYFYGLWAEENINFKDFKEKINLFFPQI